MTKFFEKAIRFTWRVLPPDGSEETPEQADYVYVTMPEGQVDNQFITYDKLIQYVRETKIVGDTLGYQVMITGMTEEWRMEVLDGDGKPNKQSKIAGMCKAEINTAIRRGIRESLRQVTLRMSDVAAKKNAEARVKSATDPELAATLTGQAFAIMDCIWLLMDEQHNLSEKDA